MNISTDRGSRGRFVDAALHCSGKPDAVCFIGFAGRRGPKSVPSDVASSEEGSKTGRGFRSGGGVLDQSLSAMHEHGCWWNGLVFAIPELIRPQL
jgi:hypothetical protein